MKKFILIQILFIFSIPLFSQSIKGEVVQRYLIFSGEGSSLTERQKEPKIFSYVYSNKKSLQKLISKDKSSIETIFKDYNGAILPTENTLISESEQNFYKDFENDIYKLVSTTNGVDLSIKDKVKVFNWNLSEEIKMINNFKCKKATTTNEISGMKVPIVAWYCEDIAINDGPIYFNGLHGFIMQIEVGNFSTSTFEKLAFTKENIQIEEPKNTAIDITFEQYYIKMQKGN